MRAAFLDAQGPRIWRFVPYVFPLALLVSAFFLPVAPVTAVVVGIAALLGVNLAGLLPIRQRWMRSAEIVCGPGYIDVLRAGARTQRIHAKSIRGGTTARTSTGVLFTLTHANRDEPILVEVENDVEADRVRHALGIGHGGFGTIAWRTVMGGAAKAGFIGRGIGVALSGLVVAVGALSSPDAGAMTALAMSQLLGLAFLLSAIGLFAPPAEPSVIMAADGLRLLTTHGWFMLPYAQVEDITVHGDYLVFKVPAPWFHVYVAAGKGHLATGLSPDDRASLVAQIRTAADRARGLGAQKNDPTGRLDVLRRNGATVRDWLVRLDMTGEMLSAGPGYRGTNLDTEDLWAILEDPEAEADLRAAAARILKHTSEPQTRVRIDAAVAAVRDEHVNRKLRIAIDDDLDAASRDLTLLEAEERTYVPPHLRFAQMR